jgi:hypothetical protein
MNVTPNEIIRTASIQLEIDNLKRENLNYLRFHHRPDTDHWPKSKLEVAYYKADRAIQDIVNLLDAA